MGRIGQEDSDITSQLVLEICSISRSSISCAHRLTPCLVESHFIDWYRLLGVKEDEGMDVIRKRYHKLALQLHPDKNKHPEAETAFKLISEAYTCLSDSIKRKAFNVERWKKFCIQCNKIPYTSCKSTANSHASKYKAWNPANWSRSYKILRNLKDIKERFKEEAKVIQNCLGKNAASRKESLLVNRPSNLFQSHHRTKKESPIFDPSEYLFQGYPHLQSRLSKKPENVWFFNREIMHKYDQARGTYDSPIFESGAERRMFKSKSTCIRSYIRY